MIQKQFQKACGSIMPRTLYVVVTSIGNLADITLRMLAVLRNADLICAEDTRITVRLLSAYDIQGRLVSVRKHNERQMTDKIVAHLSGGLIVVQVSDTGTPAVCDPGAKLAGRVRGAGFRVVPVVGASAVMGALNMAGVTESDFYFNGFLPPKSGERRKLLTKWAQADFPVVMFETPCRIEAALSDTAALFPERRSTLACEIIKTSKIFLSGTVSKIQTVLQADSDQICGEMVLILHPARREKHDGLPEAAQHIINILVTELPTKQAAELAAKITGESKKVLYDLALTCKDKGKAI